MSRRRGKNDDTPNLAEGMEGMRANYEAARNGRFLRKRSGMLLTGSSADFHYRNVTDYLRIMEYARDMDRNDAIIGASVNRAVLNTIQNGLTVDPQTPDKALNADLKARFEDWAEDKMQCDVSCQHTFTEFEEFAFRSSLVDGDDFILPLDDGSMQFVEGHRLRTPTGTKRNVVAGVLLSDTRKPVEYWLTKDDVDPFSPVALVSDVEKIPAFDGEGNPNVLHVWRGKRKTQTRGVSILAPIFYVCGMFEDINFAELVKRQIASCFAILRERDANWKPGGIDPYGPAGVPTDLSSLQARICEEIAPGFEARGLPGEKISAFSPNLPGGDFFPHIRLILQLIFINLGLPLVMGMMDASDTNFSGWRGAVDEARRGFQRNQGWLIERFHTPIYRWKLRQFMRESAPLRAAAARMGKEFFRHTWNTPKWPYIQPLQDAQADSTRQGALLSSPRRIHVERGQEWSEVIDETVADNGSAIEQAIARAQQISKATGVEVQWREILFLTNADMLKAVVKSGELGGSGGKGGGTGGQGDKVKQLTDAPDPQLAVQAFLQKVVLTLAGNSITAPLVANSLKLGQAGGVVDQAGAPVNPEYDEPYLPVQVPPGQAQVTGDVVKDPQGAIVGGDIKALPAPAPTDGTTDSADSTDSTGKTGGADKVTGGQGDTGKPETGNSKPETPAAGAALKKGGRRA